MNAVPGHAGDLGFRNIDRQHRRAELRIFVGEALAADPGFRAAAVNEALGIGFEQMALVEIYVYLDPSDTAELRFSKRPASIATRGGVTNTIWCEWSCAKRTGESRKVWGLGLPLCSHSFFRGSVIWN